MIRIISDTSTLYSVKDGEKEDIFVSPLSVTIDDQSYEEFEDINTEEFVQLINNTEKHPLSSQPSIGKVVDLYNRFPDDEILNITMADGLSGTYKSAVLATTMVNHKDKITVLNSKTLCGPHRILVQQAVKMAKQNHTMAEIVHRLESMIATTRSFLIPQDFDYLKRGGRLSHLSAFVGKTIHLVPVMTVVSDGTRLGRFAIKRNFKKAISEIIESLSKDCIGSHHHLFVSHAIAPQLAETAKEMLALAFPQATITMFLLSPAFVTQGGPGCIAIQSIAVNP